MDKAYKKLFARFPTVKDLATADEEDVRELIKNVGLHRRKAKRLKQLAEVVCREYDGKLPPTRKELLKLPGVGEYTADIIGSLVLGEPALAIDVNVARLFKRMGFVKNEKETRALLEKILPLERWRQFNKILLEFGMGVCRPLKPDCEECPLADYCRYHAQNL